MWWGWDDSPSPGVRINWGPVQDGAPICWFDFHDSAPPPSFDPHPALHLALREPGLPQHLAATAVVRVLDAFISWTENAIELHFAPLFRSVLP